MIATRALAALLLFEAITLPLEKVSLVWVGVTLSNPERQAQKKLFWTLTCAGYLKHNSGRNPHTEVQFMVYLSSAPNSYAVLDSATAMSWRKLQKTTSPGTLHSRYPQQGGGPIEIPYHWAQPSKLSAQRTNNQQDYTSVKSTGHIKTVDTINGVPTVESAIGWHPDYRISHYLAFQLSFQQSVPHSNVDERSTWSREAVPWGLAEREAFDP